MTEDVKRALSVIAQVKKAVMGKDACIIKTMTAILAGGHVLIEDIPGVGKTTLALAFSKAMGLEQTECSLPRMCFRRISPDFPFTKKRQILLFISRER